MCEDGRFVVFACYNHRLRDKMVDITTTTKIQNRKLQYITRKIPRLFDRKSWKQKSYDDYKEFTQQLYPYKIRWGKHSRLEARAASHARIGASISYVLKGIDPKPQVGP